MNITGLQLVSYQSIVQADTFIYFCICVMHSFLRYFESAERKLQKVFI